MSDPGKELMVIGPTPITMRPELKSFLTEREAENLLAAAAYAAMVATDPAVFATHALETADEPKEYRVDFKYDAVFHREMLKTLESPMSVGTSPERRNLRGQLQLLCPELKEGQINHLYRLIEDKLCEINVSIRELWVMTRPFDQLEGNYCYFTVSADFKRPFFLDRWISGSTKRYCIYVLAALDFGFS